MLRAALRTKRARTPIAFTEGIASANAVRVATTVTALGAKCARLPFLTAIPLAREAATAIALADLRAAFRIKCAGLSIGRTKSTLAARVVGVAALATTLTPECA